MSATAIRMQMVPLAGRRESFAAGSKASYGRASGDATQQAALAEAMAGDEAFPAVNTHRSGMP
jgi:hypothetical protein